MTVAAALHSTQVASYSFICSQGKQNILMLAVTSAIEDTDNSLAEPFAVEVDPLRLRTIGVYTKMDKAPDTAW